MKSVLLHYFKMMKFSIIAFVITLLMSVLSIGILGGGLFYIASPILSRFFVGGLDTWRGDWVWPVMICVPMVWSFGFLIAGRLSVYLEKMDWTKLTIQVTYVVILMLWNMLIWFVVLSMLKPKLI